MSLVDLLFPVPCAGCGAADGPACGRCRERLAAAPRLVWPRPSPAGLPPPWAVVAYRDECRDLLLAYKERGAIGLSRVLAVPLAAAIVAAARACPAAPPSMAANPANPQRLVVVPAPSARHAVRARGDDVVLVMARRAVAICRREGLSIRVVPALQQGVGVADSAGLGAVARASNLSGALQVKPPARRLIDGAEVVIADDLITTGATLAEATRALTGAGATVIGAALIAATQRHGDPGLLGRSAERATVRAIG